MVHSATDKGTAPIKPIRKSWTIGSIPATDKGFLEWREDKSLMSYGCNVLEGMVHYMNQLNFKSGERYELEMKEYKALLLSADPKDTNEDPDQTAEPAKMKAPDGTNGTTMNIPNPQNISFPNTQNIPESQPQEQSTVPILELPSQNSPSLPPPSLLPPTAARTEQEQEEKRTIQNLNANNLTMNQALELFELLQSRRAAEVVKPPYY
jgi:hypothetical protein